MTRLSRRLHRKGWARILNTSSNNMNRYANAYVETRGPRWIGRRLAVFAVRHNTVTKAEWGSIRLSSVAQVGRWRYRWHLTFHRAT